MPGAVKYSISRLLCVSALIVLCCLNSLNAQDTVPKIKIYRTWVYLKSEPFITEGVLYQVNDSSVSVSNSLVKKDYSRGSFKVENLHINDIETINIRKKNSVGKGVGFGAMAGFTTGAIIGWASGDDPPCSEMACLRYTAGQKAVISGIAIAFLGAGIGALIGSASIKIPINGSFSKYNRNKNKLRKYSIKKK